MRFHLLTTSLAVLLVASIGQPLAAQPPVGGPADLIKHGDYLVNRAVLCSDCHTPRDSKGQFDQSRFLQGMVIPIAPKQPAKDWADESPNITPSGLAGKWSEEQLVRFLMTGIDPSGNKARPPMPAFRLNAVDARAIALYLKSLPGNAAGKGKLSPLQSPPIPARLDPNASLYYAPSIINHNVPPYAYSPMYYAPPTYNSACYSRSAYYSSSYYYSPPGYYYYAPPY